MRGALQFGPGDIGGKGEGWQHSIRVFLHILEARERRRAGVDGKSFGSLVLSRP